jgi:hypothetical protein
MERTEFEQEANKLGMKMVKVHWEYREEMVALDTTKLSGVTEISVTWMRYLRSRSWFSSTASGVVMR